MRQAYEDALKDGSGNSGILTILERLLSMLDISNNKLTPEIEKFLDETLNPV